MELKQVLAVFYCDATQRRRLLNSSLISEFEVGNDEYPEIEHPSGALVLRWRDAEFQKIVQENDSFDWRPEQRLVAKHIDQFARLLNDVDSVNLSDIKCEIQLVTDWMNGSPNGCFFSGWVLQSAAKINASLSDVSINTVWD